MSELGVQLAEINPIALMVIGAIWVLLNSKKKPPATRQPPAEVSEGKFSAPAGAGLMGELGRALEELKRAEAEARGERAPQPPARVVTNTAKKGDRLVKRQVYMPKGTPAPKRASTALRGLPDVDPDRMSEEEDPQFEGRDYDDEAEKIIAARHKVAERRARVEVSAEEQSAQQAARRGARESRAIGGRAEHTDFHARRDAALAADALSGVSAPRVNPLARFANGTTRGAVILSEILGRPVGDR